MIGLGSNRLTVCRRGGMSVTQAGRGGMEWLGVRGPSWVSPYSAQATAALLAQFSLEQWPTIRDYGFAHPEIVPYVNNDPITWGGYIGVCNPLEYIITDGGSQILFTLTQSALVFEYTLMKTDSGTGEAACLLPPGAELYFRSGTINTWGAMSLTSPSSGSRVSNNTKYTFKGKANNTGSMGIGGYPSYKWYGNIYGLILKTSGGSIVADLRPVYRREDYQAGLYDMIGHGFYGNANFTNGPIIVPTS